MKSFAQIENSYRAKTNSYSYDKASNIIEKILEDNVAHSNEQIYKEVNEDNQYTSIKSNSSNVTISYDANGNIKTYKDKTFIYDFLNRLISVKQNGTTLATYTYDASNRRVSKTVSNKTITYLYHNNQVVQEYENDILTNTYLYGEYIDDPIAYSYNNNLYFYLKDNRYSVQAITNQSSSVVESYSYSPFGILTVYDENHNVVSNSNLNNTVTFTGRRYDSESNLYDYRNRMYSPELARFISKDPKGYVDGMNLYAYVKNNPLRYLDPMGTTARGSVSNSC
jgi:RHS repeat-associated protein